MSDSNLLQMLLKSGEAQIGKLAGQLMQNEQFLKAIQGAFSKSLEAKGVVDRQLGTALAALHVPTTQDMQKLNERLDELERIFEGLAGKVDTIADRLTEKQAAASAPPPADADAADR